MTSFLHPDIHPVPVAISTAAGAIALVQLVAIPMWVIIVLSVGGMAGWMLTAWYLRQTQRSRRAAMAAHQVARSTQLTLDLVTSLPGRLYFSAEATSAEDSVEDWRYTASRGALHERLGTDEDDWLPLPFLGTIPEPHRDEVAAVMLGQVEEVVYVTPYADLNDEAMFLRVTIVSDNGLRVYGEATEVTDEHQRLLEAETDAEEAKRLAREARQAAERERLRAERHEEEVLVDSIKNLLMRYAS